MPTVGAGKKKKVFPYTAKGAKAAKAYASGGHGGFVSSPSLGPLWNEIGRALEIMPLSVREAFVEAISKHVSQLPLQSSLTAEWN